MRSAPADGDRDELAAIILVGGRSSRMGCPKLWLDVAGRSLLVRVVERVLPWAGHIVLVAAPCQDLPPLDDAHAGFARPPTFMVVHDDHPGEGPLPALALGLAVTSAPWAVALGCDAPLVRPGIIHRLAAERDAAVDAVIPQWDGRPQPLVALYRPTLAPTLIALVASGERRLHAIATLPRVCLVPAEALRALDPAGDSFRCVNTPDEYAAAVATWTAEHAAVDG
jgi:molybdopterin-guanine dinucleotide biosynthesis protein A